MNGQTHRLEKPKYKSIKEQSKRQLVGNREIDLWQKGQEPRDGESKEGKGR